MDIGMGPNNVWDAGPHHLGMGVADLQTCSSPCRQRSQQCLGCWGPTTLGWVWLTYKRAPPHVCYYPRFAHFRLNHMSLITEIYQKNLTPDILPFKVTQPYLVPFRR